MNDFPSQTHAHTHAHTYAPIVDTPFDKKLKQSIRLIQAYNKWKPLTLAYSGGKDSDVVRELCALAHVPVTIVYNSTTIDPPFTLPYVISRGAVVQRPKKTFFELVAEHGLPSMFRRFCCSYLKEQYIGDCVLLGIRGHESVKRAARYKEPAQCRLFSKSCRSELVLPIVHWENSDIVTFHDTFNLKFHPLYYDGGKFDVTRRLGCIGCPLRGDRGVSDYLKYPKFLRQLCRAYSKYVDNHKPVISVYHDVVWQLFYSNHGDNKFQQTYFGLFTPPSPKQFLEDYFHIELP